MKLRLSLVLYALAWALLLPVVLLYLWRRGRRDPLYRRHLAERLGIYPRPLPQGAIWVHAVSLGELRSAVALIRRMLARGDRVVITTFTPAGRRDAEALFAGAITAGQVAVVWVPFDMRWCLRRFFRACRPQIGLTMEVDIWPGMVFAARAAGVPLFLCNGQYPERSLIRDAKGLALRLNTVRALAGAFVKSDRQAQRFRQIGLADMTVTGELRFDQPVPQALVQAAQVLRPGLCAPEREVIAIASGVEGEEDLFTATIAARKAQGGLAPLFLYVPRAPERFDAVADRLAQAGLRVIRRSAALAADLSRWQAPDAQADVLLGDSLGEMFFYLALADRVIVGGGFTPRGAHNIIEPLLLGKPVLTGPHTWTIEFPFAEAEAAGLARSLPDAQALMTALTQPAEVDALVLAAFLATHTGGTERTLKAIDRVVRR